MANPFDPAHASHEELLAELKKRESEVAALQERVLVLTAAFGPDFPLEDEAWLAPFASRFTLDDGADGQPDVHIELYSSAGGDLWLVRIGGKILNRDGELEEDRWHQTDDWNPIFKEDEERLFGSLKVCFDRASEWIRLNIDPDTVIQEGP